MRHFPESQRPSAPRVVLVTNGLGLVPGASPAARVDHLIDQAREAFAAGVDAIHLREPDLDGHALFTAAAAMARLGRVIVGERADVALAAGAAGVHLRGDGPPAVRVRAFLGQGFSLSRAVHTEDEAMRQGADPALDWLVAGTVFPTSSKPGRAPLGLDGLARLAAASHVPVIAIGGITEATVASVRAAGAHGIAGIGLFSAHFGADYVDRLRGGH